MPPSQLPWLGHSFFFNDPATTEIYTLSLHDALPIYLGAGSGVWSIALAQQSPHVRVTAVDRKSTRLNSSHSSISYAVFCLKKKQHSRVLYSLRVAISLSRPRDVAPNSDSSILSTRSGARNTIWWSTCMDRCVLFFFSDTATTEIYTLSLHDALPIYATIFPPYFVAGAIFSGFAMVLTLMIIVRKVMGLEKYITHRHIDVMAKVVIAMSGIVGLAYGTEFFMALYS